MLLLGGAGESLGEGSVEEEASEVQTRAALPAHDGVCRGLQNYQGRVSDSLELAQQRSEEYTSELQSQ